MNTASINNRLKSLGVLRPALIVALILLSACATSRSHNDALHNSRTHATAYIVNDQPTDFTRFAPAFIAEQTDQSFNRIGKPRARLDDQGKTVIDIDASEPLAYVDRQTFTTANGSYTNLIYRIHFEETPFSLFPFHITAGSNNGLLTLLTLDASNRPVLVTTVHTCGCFLAIVPTSYLPASAYPAGWKLDSQWVYGMTLPGLLELPEPFDADSRIAIFLKNETHRVMDIQVLSQEEITQHFHSEALGISPVAALMKLPVGDSTTSFYETEGSRKGYVKGSHKQFEQLLISWWAFDWRVGEDKAYGDKNETGTVFYTSLKPWNRQASDMWPFAEFLSFWGWGL